MAEKFTREDVLNSIFGGADPKTDKEAQQSIGAFLQNRIAGLQQELAGLQSATGGGGGLGSAGGEAVLKADSIRGAIAQDRQTLNNISSNPAAGRAFFEEFITENLKEMNEPKSFLSKFLGPALKAAPEIAASFVPGVGFVKAARSLSEGDIIGAAVSAAGGFSDLTPNGFEDIIAGADAASLIGGGTRTTTAPRAPVTIDEATGRPIEDVNQRRGGFGRFDPVSLAQIAAQGFPGVTAPTPAATTRAPAGADINQIPAPGLDPLAVGAGIGGLAGVAAGGLPPVIDKSQGTPGGTPAPTTTTGGTSLRQRLISGLPGLALGIGGAIAGSRGGDAALEASLAAQGFSQQAIEEIRQRSGVSQEALQPFIQAGTGALPGVEQATTVGGLDERLRQIFDLEQFGALTEERGRAVQGQLAAGGLTRSGTALTEAARVPTELGFQIENLLAGRGQQLAGTGLTAALGAGEIGTIESANIAQLLAQQGQTAASGILGEQQARGKTTQNIANTAATLAGIFFG